jgi:hypothetical protein
MNPKPIAATKTKTIVSYVILPISLIFVAVALSIDTFDHFAAVKDWFIKHWDVLIGALILWRQNQIMVRQNQIMEQQKDGDVRPVLIMEYEVKVIPTYELGELDTVLHPLIPPRAKSFKIENVGFGPAGQTWLRLDSQPKQYIGTIGHGKSIEVDRNLYEVLKANNSTLWLEYKSLYGRTYSSNARFENERLVNRTESSFSFLTGFAFFPLSFNAQWKEWKTNFRWHWLSLRYKDDELIEKHGKGRWF